MLKYVWPLSGHRALKGYTLICIFKTVYVGVKILLCTVIMIITICIKFKRASCSHLFDTSADFIRFFSKFFNFCTTYIFLKYKRRISIFLTSHLTHVRPSLGHLLQGDIIIEILLKTFRNSKYFEKRIWLFVICQVYRCWSLSIPQVWCTHPGISSSRHGTKLRLITGFYIMGTLVIKGLNTKKKKLNCCQLKSKSTLPLPQPETFS